MGRIVVTEFVSLDGVVEDPGGSEDFKYGGWSFEFDRPQIDEDCDAVPDGPRVGEPEPLAVAGRVVEALARAEDAPRNAEAASRC
jgi:hypothetical protein